MGRFRFTPACCCEVGPECGACQFLGGVKSVATMQVTFANLAGSCGAALNGTHELDIYPAASSSTGCLWAIILPGKTLTTGTQGVPPFTYNICNCSDPGPATSVTQAVLTLTINPGSTTYFWNIAFGYAIPGVSGPGVYTGFQFANSYLNFHTSNIPVGSGNCDVSALDVPTNGVPTNWFCGSSGVAGGLGLYANQSQTLGIDFYTSPVPTAAITNPN